MKVESYHFKGQRESWKVSFRPRRVPCRSGQSPAGEQQGLAAGPCTLDPGIAHLPRNVEMSTSVQRSQFHQKSARWKFSQQLCSATRKGIISNLIFLSLVPGADLGTTNFLRAAILYHFVLWCGSSEPPLP